MSICSTGQLEVRAGLASLVFSVSESETTHEHSVPLSFLRIRALCESLTWFRPTPLKSILSFEVKTALERLVLMCFVVSPITEVEGLVTIGLPLVSGPELAQCWNTGWLHEPSEKRIEFVLGEHESYLNRITGSGSGANYTLWFAEQRGVLPSLLHPLYQYRAKVLRRYGDVWNRRKKILPRRQKTNNVVPTMADERRKTMSKSSKHMAVFSVTPRENGKPFYQRVGTAFEENGGFNVLLNAVPLSGRLRIKTNIEDKRNGGEQDDQTSE